MTYAKDTRVIKREISPVPETFSESDPVKTKSPYFQSDEQDVYFSPRQIYQSPAAYAGKQRKDIQIDVQTSLPESAHLQNTSPREAQLDLTTDIQEQTLKVEETKADSYSGLEIT